MSARGLAAAVCAALVLSGCGGSDSPADEVPALAETLDQVDESLAAEDYEGAEDALTSRVDVAEQAEAEGTLSAAESEDVVGAAEALLSQLPQDEAEPPPPPEPEPTVAPEPEEKEPKPSKPPKEPKEVKEPKEPKGKDKGPEDDEDDEEDDD